MNTHNRATLLATSVAAALLIPGFRLNAAAPPGPQGVITAKEFLNIGGGTAIADLTNNAKFPNNPDLVDYSPRFEWPTGPDDATPPGPDIKNNYGVQIIGYFYPTTTGPHTFYIAADDNAVLYLSTDTTPANKKLIAREPQSNPVRDFTGTARRDLVNPENSSATFQGTQWPGGPGAPINLTAGQPYYIEALMKEGGGDDNLAVSIDGASPVPGAQLATIDKTSGPVTFTTQPLSQTIQEGTPVTFSVAVDGTPPYAYQWTRNGTDILDATNQTYTIAAVPLADNGALFRVRVTSPVGPVTSNPATLTVSNDTTPPTIARVIGSATFNSATIVFSEPVTAAAAGTLTNYSFAGLTISAATVISPTTVRLATGTQTEGASYTLTVNNIRDASVAGNTIAPNSQATLRAFVFSRGFLTWEYYGGIPGATVFDLDTFLADPRYIAGTPDRTAYFTPFDTIPTFGNDPGQGNDFGARIKGFVVPPSGGNWLLFSRSDDASRMFISSDANPANLGATFITEEPTCCGAFEEPGLGAGTETSSPIPLQAGQRYYFEAVYKEGGGGDWMQAAWRKDTDTTPAASLQPIPGVYLGTFVDPVGASVTITQQPQPAVIVENTSATFTVGATGSSTVFFYQWQKAPAAGAFTDIAGANTRSYTTPAIPLSENGSRYRVMVSVPSLTVDSAEAAVTVTADTVPPTLASAIRSFTNNSQVIVVFNELMQAATANLASNYQINNGIQVTAAALQADGRSVLLTTSPIANGTSNTLTVSGVKDLAGNTIATNSQVVIGFQRGALFVIAGGETPTPNASDGLVKSRLESRGYHVELIGSDVDDVSMATGKDIVVLSSTFGSGTVIDTYKLAPVPVLEWEQAIQDDMAMTTLTGTTDRGTTVGLTSIEIVNPSHPMATGFPAGVLTVVATASEFVWGQPNTNAQVVARLVGTQNAAIYGYDKGAFLTDDTPAAERRVLFLMTDNVMVNLNADGLKLFDAAVDWAQNITFAAQPRFAPPTFSAGSLRLQWTGSGTLQQTDSLSPPNWQPAPSQTNPQTVSATTGSRYYRIAP